MSSSSRSPRARLAEAGRTDATWIPLIHLHESGDSLHQKDLALRIGFNGSTLVRLLDILSRYGLIERREDDHDRRAIRPRKHFCSKMPVGTWLITFGSSAERRETSEFLAARATRQEAEINMGKWMNVGTEGRIACFPVVPVTP